MMRSKNKFIHIQFPDHPYQLIRVEYFDTVYRLTDFIVIVIEITYDNSIGSQVMIKGALDGYTEFSRPIYQYIFLCFFYGAGILKKNLDRSPVGNQYQE